MNDHEVLKIMREFAQKRGGYILYISGPLTEEETKKIYKAVHKIKPELKTITDMENDLKSSPCPDIKSVLENMKRDHELRNPKETNDTK